MSSKDKGGGVTLVVGRDVGASHAEHLRMGTCGSNGSVKILLTTLVASAQGYAVAATFIPHISTLTRLCLTVHATDGHLMACGNLTDMMPM